MKKTVFLCLGSLLLIAACSESEKETTTANESTTFETVETIEPTEQDENLVESESTSEPFYLEDFPQEWNRLTEEAGEMVIYHYCEAEDQQIWIEPKKGDEWEMTILHGQDSEVWSIIGFDATEYFAGGVSEVKGSIELHPLSTYQEEGKTLSFTWDRSMATCTFEGIYDNPTQYAVSERIDLFTEISEDCEGLWD